MDTKVSGAHPDDRDPQLLGDQVDRLVADRGWELELRVRGVFARWPELVGAEVGAHCTPESFADGRLVVRTDSTAWATQLTLLAPTVVRRLNEELGHGTVTAIDVQGPHLPTWSQGPAPDPRQPGAPRHLRLSRTSGAGADLRAARPYGDMSDPLCGPLGGLHGPLRAVSRDTSPPGCGGMRGMRAVSR